MFPNAIVEHFLWKCVAVVVAILYVAFAASTSGVATAVMVLILSVIPVSFIWFPGEMSTYIKPWLRAQIFQQFPALVTRSVGWFILIPVLGFTVIVA